MKIVKTSVALAAATFASIAISLPAHATTTAHKFANCDAMHRVFAHGVGDRCQGQDIGRPRHHLCPRAEVVAQNTASDRDQDGIACEAA